MPEDVEHHTAPEIVINWDGTLEKRIALVGDYGQKIELSADQFERLAEEVLSPRSG